MDAMKTLKLLNEKISIELLVVRDPDHKQRLENLLSRIQASQMIGSGGFGDMGDFFKGMNPNG